MKNYKSKILFIAVILSLTNCASKNFVKTKINKKIEVDSIAISKLTIKQNKLFKVTDSLLVTLREVTREVNSKELENENKTTTIEGTIEAEEGKEKTFISDDLKITTNGAKVSFKSVNSKTRVKEFESRFKSVETELREIKASFEAYKDSLSIANKAKIEYEKKEKVKEIKKHKESKWWWWLCLLPFLGLGVYYIYKRVRRESILF